MNLLQAPTLPRGVYALCDDTVRPDLPLLEKARLLVEGGVGVIQLRMKRTPVREALDAATAIAQLCRERGVLCVVNDRVDLAWLSGAHGVHLGDEDLPVAEARRLLGPGALVGATVRSGSAAKAAAAEGASYVGVGPVFPTATKQVNAALLGVDGLAAVVRESPLPVVAIAGIGRANIGQVAAAGAQMAAVVSELLLAPDIPAHARLLAATFERAGRTA